MAKALRIIFLFLIAIVLFRIYKDLFVLEMKLNLRQYLDNQETIPLDERTNQTEKTTKIYKNVIDFLDFREMKEIEVFSFKKINRENNLPFQEVFLTALKNQLNVSGIPQRNFDTTWSKTHPFPCFPKSRLGKTRGMGQMYIKLPKVASSTLAGIALRIKNRHVTNSTICPTLYDHKPRSAYPPRDKNNSFLWSFVRHPTKRAISDFSFAQVSQRDLSFWKREKYINLFKKHVIGGGFLGFQKGQIGYLSEKPKSLKNFCFNGFIKNLKMLYEYIQTTLDEYDFIGLVERFDESLVVLQLIFGLNVGDILYISSKVSNNDVYYSHIRQPNCFKLKSANVTPEMKKYFKSNFWYVRNAADFLLFMAVNQSLDNTIQQIGSDKFEKALTEYRNILPLAQEKCTPFRVFPCSPNGTLQRKRSSKNCYFDDCGCGYKCLDSFYNNYTKHKLESI